MHGPHDNHICHMLHMSFRGVQRVPSNVTQVWKGRRSCLRHLLRLLFGLRSRARAGRGDRPARAEGAAILASMPRIYTKTGDDGTTGLLYGGRVSKADLVPDACGTIDEAVAVLGLARAHASDPSLSDELMGLQRELFVVGADLATNPDGRVKLEPGVSLVSPDMVARLESRIDELVEAHPLANAFIVPGANPVSAFIDLARATIRRAERRVVELRESGAVVNEDAFRYLNRLSDALFVLARVAAGEVEPRSRTDEPRG
jgi:cob(I)alamin adenosyltransferase